MAKKHVRRIIEVDGRRVVESKPYTPPVFPVGGTPPVEVKELSEERKQALRDLFDVKPALRPPHAPTYPRTHGAYSRDAKDFSILNAWAIEHGYLQPE